VTVATLVPWGPNQLALALLAAYALAGLAIGTALSRRGQPASTALSALAVWPLLVPLLSSPPPPLPVRSGPLSERIDGVFAALGSVLAETGTTELSSADLERLRSALHRADERLALVDGLLGQPIEAGGDVARSVDRLRQARAHAGSEIEAVLAGLVELRLQIGLLTLSGGGSVREQLKALQSRVAALEEVDASCAS
jgi:hypothetical protein